MWSSATKQLLSKFKIEHPIIQAPMVGGSTSQLVAAVSNAGGLGSLGAALLSPEQLRKAILEIRNLTDKSFNINLFAPTDSTPPTETQIKAANSVLEKYRKELHIDTPPPAIEFSKSFFEEKLAVIREEKVPVFSFTFNILSAEVIHKLKQANIVVIGTATSVAEALLLEKNGVDVIVAQGFEAGGHRGTPPDIAIEDALIGTIALVPQIVDAVNIPVVAAGGIMDGRGILATLILGASAVQMGTAFLSTPEAGIHAKHVEALLTSTDSSTRLTRIFTGRFARGIKNRLMLEMEAHQGQCLSSPYQRTLMQDIRKKAYETNNTDFMQFFSGQAAHFCKTKPAGELVKMLVSEVQKLLSELGS